MKAQTLSALQTPNQALILWARECLRRLTAPGSAWAPALNPLGVDPGELCFEECFLRAQKAVEGAPPAAPPARSLKGATARVGRVLARRAQELAAQLRGARPERTDVVFLPVEPTHLTQQVPVAAAMARRARVQFVTPRPMVAHALARKGFDAVLVQSAWREVADAGRAGRRAVEALEAPPGVALPPPPRGEAAPLLEALRAALSETLPGAYEAVCAAELVLAELKPRLVVLGNDLTVGGRALARAAARAKVPSASIMHGTVLDALHEHHIADRLLVYGDAHRRHLVERQGIAPTRVAVTGAPYLDVLPRQSGQTDERVRAQLGLKPGEPFVLVAISNPANMVTMEQHERTIQAVMRLSSRLELPIVARLHRGDSQAHFERVAGRVPGQRVVVVRNDSPAWPGSILEWLQGCRLLLTGASAVAVEAMLLDVPVVSMDFTGDYGDVDFIRAGATEHVTSEEGLFEAAAKLVERGPAAAALGKRAAGFLGDYFYRLDRGAAERCAVELDGLMRAASCAA